MCPCGLSAALHIRQPLGVEAVGSQTRPGVLLVESVSLWAVSCPAQREAAQLEAQDWALRSLELQVALHVRQALSIWYASTRYNCGVGD